MLSCFLRVESDSALPLIGFGAGAKIPRLPVMNFPRLPFPFFLCPVSRHDYPPLPGGMGGEGGGGVWQIFQI